MYKRILAGRRINYPLFSPDKLLKLIQMSIKISVLALFLAGAHACCFAQEMTGNTEKQGHAAAKGFKTLAYLYEVSGKKTISGIHNREPNDTPAMWTYHMLLVTGKYPALWSGDFLFQQENISNRQKMIDEALVQWKKGAIINLMWHACNPALAEPCGWDDKGVKSHLSDEQWKELLTDGSPINKKWKAMMDEVAVYLKYLQDHGVEVLWRPLHEMNQGVFWWGGRPGENGTSKLYRITHDYFTKEKKLNNLVWVWDIQDFKTLRQDAMDYNPGTEYYDVAAMDMYDDSSGYSTEKYEIMKAACKGKPIAIGECQKYPTPFKLKEQPQWTFFMGWAELVFDANTEKELKDLMNAPNVITLSSIHAGH
jgi:mannan endo-1,4-beta-mannosidase